MTAYRATRCTCKYAVEIYVQRGRLSSTFYPYERALRTSSDRNLCLAATRSEWELGCYTLSPPFFSSPRNSGQNAHDIARDIAPSDRYESLHSTSPFECPRYVTFPPLIFLRNAPSFLIHFDCTSFVETGSNGG